MCRSTMAAAMNGEKLEQLVSMDKVPSKLQKYGSKKEELFIHLPELCKKYNCKYDDISLGAVGAYSFIKKTNFGLQHFSALNRKFDIKYVNQLDLIPLNETALELIHGRWFQNVNSYEK